MTVGEHGTELPDRPAPDAGAVTDEATPDHDPTAPDHAHPTELAYIKVALILAVVTLIEVAVYYVPSIEGALVPILLTLSLIKFVLVVLWFMHLRFDSRIFRRLFVTGVILAIFVYLIVLTTFHVWTR
ncbi:MAG TPA: cytochrome C oxidase subunit IV family protein [Acidimicrobiales bacterium]|nr:cytochrome C oxidase subunit IV family protein [Acidimicrobiales bacterium]